MTTPSPSLHQHFCHDGGDDDGGDDDVGDDDGDDDDDDYDDYDNMMMMMPITCDLSTKTPLEQADLPTR